MDNIINSIKKLFGFELELGASNLPMLDGLSKRFLYFDEYTNASTTLNTDEKASYLSFSNLGLFLLNNQSDLSVIVYNYMAHANKRTNIFNKLTAFNVKSKNLLARQASMICYEIIQDSKFLTGKSIRESITNAFSVQKSQELLTELSIVVTERKSISNNYENIFKHVRNSTIAHKGSDARMTLNEINSIKELELISASIKVLNFITRSLGFLNILLQALLDNNSRNSNLGALPLPAVMGRLTAALSGDEESPGNAEHPAS